MENTLKVGARVRMESGKLGDVTDIRLDDAGKVETVYVELDNEPYFTQVGNEPPQRLVGRPFEPTSISEVLDA